MSLFEKLSTGTYRSREHIPTLRECQKEPFELGFLDVATHTGTYSSRQHIPLMRECQKTPLELGFLDVASHPTTENRVQNLQEGLNSKPFSVKEGFMEKSLLLSLRWNQEGRVLETSAIFFFQNLVFQKLTSP